MSDDETDDEIPEQIQAEIKPNDPYSVLNLRKGATDDEIQRSYKHLSRAFHPDKQPPGPQREEAQEVFVDFKNAHDILTDPVLRQAYDDHGHYGVYFVRRSMTSSDDSLFVKLSNMHRSGKPGAARAALNEAIQSNDFQSTSRSQDVSGSIELKCNVLNTSIFGEGVEAVGIPEVEKTSMSFSVSSPQSNDSKWSTSFGGSSQVKNGEGRASGQVSLRHNPVQGTDLTLEVDIGEESKVSFGTTRVMTSRTLIATSISTVPQSDKFALSLSSHRPLFQNKIRGTWAIGLSSPDFSLHYGLLSFTTLNTRPRYTAKLNVGLSKFPFKISADHSFTQSHIGHFSFGWGTSGIEVSATMTRMLSRYAKFSIGLRHATMRGLTWLLRLQRGGISFSVPIIVSSTSSPGYPFKCLYLSFLSALIDEALGDLLSEVSTLIVDDLGKENKAALRREEDLIELNKARREARQQVELMIKPAEEKRKSEEAKNGLVIWKATYQADGGDVLDVTTQLQFWVAHSSLRLPSSPKCNLLGFYDVRRAPTDEDVGESKTFGWRAFLNRYYSWGLVDLPTTADDRPMPTLTVRYKFQGGIYEITILDHEELSLPCDEALKLGDSNVVS